MGFAAQFAKLLSDPAARDVFHKTVKRYLKLASLAFKDPGDPHDKDDLAAMFCEFVLEELPKLEKSQGPALLKELEIDGDPGSVLLKFLDRYFAPGFRNRLKEKNRGGQKGNFQAHYRKVRQNLSRQKEVRTVQIKNGLYFSVLELEPLETLDLDETENSRIGPPPEFPPQKDVYAGKNLLLLAKHYWQAATGRRGKTGYVSVRGLASWLGRLYPLIARHVPLEPGRSASWAGRAGQFAPGESEMRVLAEDLAAALSPVRRKIAAHLCDPDDDLTQAQIAVKYGLSTSGVCGHMQFIKEMLCDRLAMHENLSPPFSDEGEAAGRFLKIFSGICKNGFQSR